MASVKCGFNDVQGGATGAELLSVYGPTLLVDIGFDANWSHAAPTTVPVPGISGIHALVDTGASESCIDSLLAGQLNLPIVDKRMIGGISGAQEVNMYFAQVHIATLGYTIYGLFAGVHLAAAGQAHKALIGRTFLRNFTMVYEGRSGNVTISS
jgi:hypothetical protein